jgi:hypothetical protein
VLVAARKTSGVLFLALICVAAGEICCLAGDDFEGIWACRQRVAGNLEDTFWLNVVLPTGKGFRVYADYPGRRNLQLGESLIVPRADFPNRICS